MKNKKIKALESGFSFFERDTDVVVRSHGKNHMRTEGAVIMTGLGGIITIQGTQH